jgi:hypothetical protein
MRPDVHDPADRILPGKPGRHHRSAQASKFEARPGCDVARPSITHQNDQRNTQKRWHGKGQNQLGEIAWRDDCAGAFDVVHQRRFATCELRNDFTRGGFSPGFAQNLATDARQLIKRTFQDSFAIIARMLYARQSGKLDEINQ